MDFLLYIFLLNHYLIAVSFLRHHDIDCICLSLNAPACTEVMTLNYNAVSLIILLQLIFLSGLIVKILTHGRNHGSYIDISARQLISADGLP